MPWRIVIPWLTLGLIFVALSLVPHLELPNGVDKACHFLVNFCYILLPALLLKKFYQTFLIALFLLSCGIGIELVQAYSPGRSSSLADVLANSIGIVLGLLVGYCFHRRRSLRELM